MPKIVNTDEKKREIAGFALENFLNLGYRKTTIQSISLSSRIGRSTFYQYFENKEEIFCEAILYLLDEVKRRISVIAEDPLKNSKEKYHSLFSMITELPKGKTLNVFELSQIVSSFEKQRQPLIEAIQEMELFLISLFDDFCEKKEGENSKFLASLWKNLVIMYYENSFPPNFMEKKIEQLATTLLEG